MEKKITLNCCPGNGCHAGCIMKTYVENGKIVGVKKLTYPSGEKGDICLRGVAGARLPYHPDRLKYPLKRLGKRGEGRWDRITWEQALDEIAAKITTIRKEYQPKSLVMMEYCNSVPSSETQPFLGTRLRNLLGATDLKPGSGIDTGSLFSAYFTHGTSYAHFIDPRVIIKGKTQYLITWGCNPAEMSQRFWRFIREAQKKGAKLVDIGLMADPTAKASDWWIPVKPGSDGTLALAMINVIIRDRLYNKSYVLQHTNGPFLVRLDSWKLLRASDISPEGAKDNYIVWDTLSDRPQAIVPHAPCPAGIKPALDGVYAPGGIACKPAFQLLAEMASEHSPEKVAFISGVSVETIEKLAQEYAAAKPAAIIVRFGLRYANSGNAYRAIDTLSALTGNIGVMGGGTLHGHSQGQINAPLLKLNDKAIKQPVESRTPVIPMARVFEGMMTESLDPIKALILYGANLLHTFPNPQRWIEKVLPNLDLFVVNDIFMTATAEYADYVLPDCTLYEREDMDIGLDGYILWLDKAIEPLYECRPPIYFWSELGKRLGFGEYFDKTIEEWTALRLDSADASLTGIEPKLTVERLKKEKIVRANVPEGLFHPWLTKEFPTPSGRLELYNEELLPAGDALPVFREQLESPRSTLAEKYPLVFLTANNKYFVHSMFANVPSILEQYLKEPHLSINPADAEKRHISDGDIVIIYNERGSCKAKALISNVVPPGTVNLPHGWWPRQYIEGHHNNLLFSIPTRENRDKAREIFWELACERVKLGAGQVSDVNSAYSLDTIFDCLCEVKKC